MTAQDDRRKKRKFFVSNVKFKRKKCFKNGPK